MMPVEESSKKKHKLFPFNIIRKRSTGKGKGKSKSLVDLYDVQTDERRNGEVLRRKRLSHHSAVNTSFESRGEEGEVSVDEDGQALTVKVVNAPVEDVRNEGYMIDNDEIDGLNVDESKEIVDFDDSELIEMEPDREKHEELVGDDEDMEEQTKFPPGTTVCMNIYPFV